VSRPNRAEAPSRDFHLRLSPDERERVDQAAKLNRQSSSDFGREALVTAADDCLEAWRAPHS
jgi:uncharacterized protein (DUF1778 family)